MKGNQISAINIYAPSTVKLSATKIAFNPYGSYPSVTVYDSVGNLISPSEYVVTYDDNFKTGKAWVYVNFVGNNYKGELTSSFMIIPAKPTPTSLKSKKSKQITYSWNKIYTKVLRSRLIYFLYHRPQQLLRKSLYSNDYEYLAKRKRNMFLLNIQV